MYSEEVINLLHEIPDTEGTRAYLKIMNYSVTSFLCKVTDVKERLYRIWYVVFFLRMWKSWILSSKQYTLKDNFITNNAYTCIEINAHNLIKIVKIFRSTPNLDSTMFHPSLFSS